MRLYPPIYPGDSILRPGRFPGGDFSTSRAVAVFRTLFVRSNIATETTLIPAAPVPEIDIATIEDQARTARAIWIGSKLKSYYVALVSKFERAGPTERDNFLGASQCLAELEERIRLEERRQSQAA